MVRALASARCTGALVALVVSLAALAAPAAAGTSKTTTATTVPTGRATAAGCPAGDRAVQDLYYVAGGRRTPELTEALAAGGPVIAVFTLVPGCRALLSLVASTPAGVFSAQTASFEAGPNALQVLVPPCPFRVRLVRGGAAAHVPRGRVIGAGACG